MQRRTAGPYHFPKDRYAASPTARLSSKSAVQLDETGARSKLRLRPIVDDPAKRASRHAISFSRGNVCGSLLVSDGDSDWELQHAALDPRLRILTLFDDKFSSHPRTIVDLSTAHLVSGGRQRDKGGVFLHSFMLHSRSYTLIVAAEDESVAQEWQSGIHYLRRLCLSHVSAQYFAAYDDQHPVDAVHSKVLHFVKQQSLPQYEAAFIRELPQTPTVHRQVLAQYLQGYNFVMEVEHPRGKPPQWRLIDLQDRYATKIQALWRAKQAQRRVWGEGGVKDEHDCAVHMQCRVRSRTARRERRRRHEAREATLRERALALIKKRLTNFVQRRRETQALVSAIHETRERHNAAIKIQAGVRHRLARNLLHRLRKAHLEAVWNASSEIVKYMFYRLMGIAKRRIILRSKEIERRLIPFKHAPFRDEQRHCQSPGANCLPLEYVVIVDIRSALQLAIMKPVLVKSVQCMEARPVLMVPTVSLRSNPV